MQDDKKIMSAKWSAVCAPLLGLLLVLPAPWVAADSHNAGRAASSATRANPESVAAPAAAPLRQVQVQDAWINAAPAVAKNSVAFVTLQAGAQADVLLGVSSPIAQKVEIHQTTLAGGLLRMQRLPRINLPAQSRVALSADGRHLMLIGLQRPLQQGEHIPLTLVFRQAGAITVDALVREPQPRADAVDRP